MAAAPQSGDIGVIERILSGSGDLAVMPQVVYQIVEMIRSETASAQDLEREIVVDPGFSAKVLGQANSAYYALPKRVTSIREAVMFLGFKQVRQIALQVGVFDFFVGKNDKESLRRRAWWRHALDTAVCSRSVSRFCKIGDSDVAYTIGLLHTLGKSLMCRFDPELYNKVEFLIENGAPVWQAEQVIYGANHVDVLMAAAAKWGFPEELVFALDYIREAKEDEPQSGLRAVLALGESIASIALSGSTDPDHDEVKMPAWALARLGLSQEHIRPLAMFVFADMNSASKEEL